MIRYKIMLLLVTMVTMVGCSTVNGMELNRTVNSIQVTEGYNLTQLETEIQSDTVADTVINTEAVVYSANDYMSELGERVAFSDGDEIVITKSGTYELVGNYSSSTISVNVNKDIDDGIVYLILNNANIVSENATPINILEAKDVVIVLEGENSITQGEVETTDEAFPSAAIYSKADTVITGDGSLTVSTLYNDGINSRDDLIIDDTTIHVNAVEDGIVGKDFLAISESDITVIAGKDGLKTSNAEELGKGNLIVTSGNFNITAQNDGISSEQILQIDGGIFNITSGGGFVEVLNEITRGEGSGNTVSVTSLLEESMKGLKGLNLILNAGEFNISSYEDAVHADDNLSINSGTYHIISGDDALHADNDLVINDIDLVVENAYEGIEGSTVTINGGDITVNVLDDAINAGSENGYVKITDGTINLKAQGDGIDSNGDLVMEGGEIVIEVNAIYSGGDSELDVTGVYTISGGTIVDENGIEVSPTTQRGGGGGGRGQMPQMSGDSERVAPNQNFNQAPANGAVPNKPANNRP